MKTCTNCKIKPICKIPCEWLERQLKKQTKERNRNEIIIPLDILEEIQSDLPAWKEMAIYFSEDNVSFPQLSILQNKLLKGFCFDGLSYKKLAERHHINTKRIENELYRAKKRLNR